MTLTHIMPSLRRTMANPLTRDLWPEFTTVTIADVTIAGVSLLRLVDWCGTPAVHTASAVVPGTGGRPSETELASVVVTRVTGAEVRSDGTLDVRVDAELGGCDALFGEARLIGRISTARDQRAELRFAGAARAVSGVAELPDDIRSGDVIALPCRGATSLHDVDPAHGARSAAGLDADAWFPAPACGR